MNHDLLNTVNQEFINYNLNSDVATILFKKHPELSVDVKLLVEQIEAKKKCKTKLPSWYNTKEIYYPNKLNIEQTSSEITAKYKSNLINGKSIIDLTGGFGVDAFYFSKRFDKVVHCEIKKDLSAIAKHNYNQMHITNIECINRDGLDFLSGSNRLFDWIYVDPSRRHEHKGKVFQLSDCIPNVPDNLDLLFNHSNNIMVKTSPLLDISQGSKELKHVKSIQVIAVNNEVKELLWILKKDNQGSPNCITVNIKGEIKQKFNYKIIEEKVSIANYSEPLSYLYEPNAAILKSGAFKLVSKKFSVYKLHSNTHLYTSDTLVEFPGKRFKVKKVMPYNKKLLKKEFVYSANVATRNFPLSVHQLRRDFKIKDGNSLFIFFTTSSIMNKVIIICEKID